MAFTLCADFSFRGIFSRLFTVYTVLAGVQFIVSNFGIIDENEWQK